MRALPFLLILLCACDGGDDDTVILDSGPRDTGTPDSGLMPEPSTTALDLGAIVLGTSKSGSFTFSNPNSASLTISLSPPLGPNAASFERWVNIPERDGSFKLEPGGTATITVTATPESEGTIQGELELNPCAAMSSACVYRIALLAEGVRSGVTCPAEVDLGLANPGGCISRKVSCINRGNATERITIVELEPASDPSFTLLEPALPIDLAPGGTVSLDVDYCPTVLGSHEGEITVATFTPFRTERTIHLAGRAGGADLSCRPESIDFGAVGVGATVMASIACTNTGYEAAVLTATLESGAEFSLAESTLSIEPGVTDQLQVVHMPASPGAKTDTLRISSNDPDRPEIEIPLSSQALMVEPCSAVLDPASLDLGLVGIGDARIARFYLRNTGTNACLIREVRLGPGPGSGADLRLIDPPGIGSTIDPGATRAIDVELAPQTNGTAGATLVVAFTNPGVTELSATIEAVAGVTPLAIDPPVIDFGPSPTGCGAPHEKRVVIRRIAGGSGRVLNLLIQNDASAAFSLSATPQELAFYQSMEAIVSFDPPAAGRHSAELHIFTDASTTPIIIPISGEAVATAERSESTVLAPRAVDLLFLVDDSCSMGPAQQALSDALPVLDQIRIDRRADARAAVITTDMESPERSGRFQGSPGVLDGSSSTFLADLAARVMPGIGGSGNEMGLLALYSAVTPPLITAENAGFLRPNADLAVIVVTDENDYSPSSPGIPSIVAALRRAAGDGRLIAAGIVGPPNGNCSGPYGTGNEAQRWAELIGRVQDNLQTSFCSTMDRNLRAIAARIFGESAVALGGRPIISTIAVSIDGTPLPASAWTYDLSTNRVVIFDSADAPIGATLAVTYRTICLSPTCGDGTVDPGEQCDDQTDACIGCNDAVCGDGLARSGAEQCDDGNLFDGDACLPGCIAASCGDGALQLGVEACDDGNTVDGDGCPSTCRFYQLAGPTPQTFVPLVNGTALTFTGGADPFDDGTATLILPFELRLFDVPTSTLTVSVNGFVSATDVGAQSWVNTGFPDTDLPDGVIAPWWDDLQLDLAIAGGAQISWAVLGGAPDRVVVIEWTDVRLRDHNTANHRRFTFQLRLEESGTIQFAYADTETSGAVPSVASASAGIEDPAASRGIEALGCSPNCDGRPRPPRADGFPVQSVVTFAP